MFNAKSLAKWKRRIGILGLSAMVVAALAPMTSFAGDVGNEGSGGGGTLPVDPASPETVIQVIQRARKDLRVYARVLESNYDQATADSLQKKLFGDKRGRTLLEVIEHTRIETRLDRPCYDMDGKEVDGSAAGASPFAPFEICISVHRIAPKVVDELARPVVLALILHEFSHRLGATEAEAVQMQKMAFPYLRKNAVQAMDDLLVRLRDQSLEAVDDLRSALYWLSNDDQDEKFRLDVIHRKVSRDPLRNVISEMARSAYAFHSREQRDYFAFMYVRQKLVQAFLVGRQHASDKSYENFFSGHETRTYAQYLEAKMPDSWIQSAKRTSLYTDAKYAKIEGRDDLRAELSALYTYWQAQSAYFQALSENLELPK